MAKGAQGAGRESDELVARELVAVDVERRRVDQQLVARVGGEQLRWRDDRPASIARVQAQIEGNVGADGDRAPERHGIHLAGEVEVQVGGGVDGAVAAARGRRREEGRPLGDERPVMTEGVGVACRVAIARLEDDLVGGAGAEGGVLVGEAAAVEPAHGAGRRGLEAQPALHRGAIDLVVEGDDDRGGGRNVDGVALGGVVDDLGRVAAASRQRQKHDHERAGGKKALLLRAHPPPVAPTPEPTHLNRG